MTTEAPPEGASYRSPTGKPLRELSENGVAEWIRKLEVDVAEGLTPWNMKQDVIDRANSAEAARIVSPEEMEWRRANPDRVWLEELLKLHRIRHWQPRLWQKFVNWD